MPRCSGGRRGRCRFLDVFCRCSVAGSAGTPSVPLPRHLVTHVSPLTSGTDRGCTRRVRTPTTRQRRDRCSRSRQPSRSPDTPRDASSPVLTRGDRAVVDDPRTPPSSFSNTSARLPFNIRSYRIISAVSALGSRIVGLIALHASPGHVGTLTVQRGCSGSDSVLEFVHAVVGSSGGEFRRFRRSVSHA